MGQLTPEDFARMQREAKARVAEMQKRSRFYAERNQQGNKQQTSHDDGTNRTEPPKPLSGKAAEKPVPVDSADEKRKDDAAELLFLFSLSILLGEEDRDLFLLLMLIMME